MQTTADDQSNHKEVWKVGAASSLQPISPSDSQQPAETTHQVVSGQEIDYSL